MGHDESQSLGDEDTDVGDFVLNEVEEVWFEVVAEYFDVSLDYALAH